GEGCAGAATASLGPRRPSHKPTPISTAVTTIAPTAHIACEWFDISRLSSGRPSVSAGVPEIPPTGTFDSAFTGCICLLPLIITYPDRFGVAATGGKPP